MTKASDNVFPKINLGPLGAPSTPADASWKMYAMADGVYAKSSNTTVGPLGAGGSGIAKGTSNPGSPADGDLFYRTDLDMLIRYRSSGTRWVGPQQILTFGNQQAVSPWAATTALRTSHPGITYDIFAESFWADTYTATTSSGTQYWTIALDGTGVTLSTINNAANTVVREGTANNVAAVIATGSATWITVTITKVSTPGTLYADPILTYRLIIT